VSLIQMSIAGAVMIVVIILIRALAINRLPKITFTILWVVVTARLLVPVSVPSVFSVYSLFDSAPVNVSAQLSAGNAESVADAAGSAPDDIQQIQPHIIRTDNENSISVFALVWVTGVVIALACFGAAYFVCFRKLSKAKDVSHPAVDRWMDGHSVRKSVAVRSSGDAASPLTYGLFRPVIVLPDKMDLNDTERLGYVLSHEMTHIRRFDLLKKLAVILAVCLHWFNPLVWVMFIIFNRDIELACDETVVLQAGHRSGKAYAMALIHMEEKRSLSGTLYTCFNKNAIEERIVAIMKIKRPTFARLAVSAVIVAAVCLVFATTAYANQDSDTELPTAVSAVDIDELIGTDENADIIEPASAEAAEAAPEETAEAAPERESEEKAEDAAEEAPDAAPEASKQTGWIWPVDSDRITRAFGPSSNPLRGSSDHITIACNRGDPVVSAVSGKVSEAEYTPEYGNYVVICGEDNVRVMYAHLDDISVSVGQTAAAGDKIGTAGATGMVTGPCLSFYVYVSDQAVDPVSFYE